MGFSKQGYWNGLPFHLPGNVSNPGIMIRGANEFPVSFCRLEPFNIVSSLVLRNPAASPRAEARAVVHSGETVSEVESKCL